MKRSPQLLFDLGAGTGFTSKIVSRIFWVARFCWYDSILLADPQYRIIGACRRELICYLGGQRKTRNTGHFSFCNP